MCVSVPGRVTQINGAMAEVEREGRMAWFNALAQPDVQVGDYVLVHGNLIISIISEAEAQRTRETIDEVERMLANNAAKDDAFDDRQ